MTAAALALGATNCVPYAEAEVSGRDSLTPHVPVVGRAFRASFPHTGYPIRLSLKCTAAGFEGALQRVELRAAVETAAPPAEASDTDMVEPPWTDDLFDAEKLSAHAELELECEAAEGCEQVFRVECSSPEMFPDTALDVKYEVTAKTRVDYNCASRHIELEETSSL